MVGTDAMCWLLVNSDDDALLWVFCCGIVPASGIRDRRPSSPRFVRGATIRRGHDDLASILVSASFGFKAIEWVEFHLDNIPVERSL